MLSGMLFIFLSLLELAVVGFMSRNDGLPPKEPKKKKLMDEKEEEFSWKNSESSPQLELRQFWVDKRLHQPSPILNHHPVCPHIFYLQKISSRFLVTL